MGLHCLYLSWVSNIFVFEWASERVLCVSCHLHWKCVFFYSLFLLCDGVDEAFVLSSRCHCKIRIIFFFFAAVKKLGYYAVDMHFMYPWSLFLSGKSTLLVITKGYLWILYIIFFTFNLFFLEVHQSSPICLKAFFKLQTRSFARDVFHSACFTWASVEMTFEHECRQQI